MIFIFYLRLGERGFKRDGPEDRFLAAVDEALFHKRGKGTQNVGFECGCLGLVLIRPVGENAEAFELGGLCGDPAFGKLVASGAELSRGEGEFFFLYLARNLLLYRQAVAVPTGDIRRAVPAHCLVAVDDVLERLVQCGADMDVAIGERRTIVQDEGRLPGAAPLNPVVKAEFFPMRHPGRLALDQTRPHGKIGLGEQEGVFQV